MTGAPLGSRPKCNRRITSRPHRGLCADEESAKVWHYTEPMRRRSLRTLIIVVALLAPCVPAQASDRRMLRAAAAADAVERASLAAGPRSPVSVQRAYDVARDMREALRAAQPVSPSCRRFGNWAVRFADAAADVANGYDRLAPARVQVARDGARRARAAMRAARAACRPGSAPPQPPIPTLRAPRPGAAFFGAVVAEAPAGADAADLVVDGSVAGPLDLRPDGTARARMLGDAGRHSLEVRFRRGGAVIARAVSRNVWLLPSSARERVRAPAASAALQQRLRDAAARFDGVAGIWVHDLASGRAGSWNAGARLPAASVVKLGVMVEALRRAGARPEASRHAPDVAAIGAWSSNLAPNRLMRVIGGPRGAEAGLRRLGARSSTYPGDYIVATSAPPVVTVAQPALATRRVTTAADMGRAITTIHRAARGERAARRATGLSLAQARLLLGDLLASQPVGDNLGIIRQGFEAGTPIAQKHGWISSTRITVAVAYTVRGPVVIVVLATGTRVTRAGAAALGSEVVRAVVG